jgi:TusA-related sulfurtransferase
VQRASISAGTLVVDGTKKECKGVLSELEQAMERVDSGAPVHAIVADVPSRIDVRAWAERKGHLITQDGRADGHFHMVIVKSGRALAPPK